MGKLEFAFKRGDILSGEIFAEQIPETWKALKSFLPATLTILNARWSGREVHAQCLVPDRPPRENQTITFSEFRIRRLGVMTHYWRSIGNASVYGDMLLNGVKSFL